MRKPWENKKKLEDGRGGANFFVACPGSFTDPSYVQESILEDGSVAGSCAECGKWCKLRFGKLPRHKAVSDVVRAWDRPDFRGGVEEK